MLRKKRLKSHRGRADKTHMSNEEKARILRGASRVLHKGMKRGGPMTSAKGKRGYTRKCKHKGRND